MLIAQCQFAHRIGKVVICPVNCGLADSLVSIVKYDGIKFPQGSTDDGIDRLDWNNANANYDFFPFCFLPGHSSLSYGAVSTPAGLCRTGVYFRPLDSTNLYVKYIKPHCQESFGVLEDLWW